MQLANRFFIQRAPCSAHATLNGCYRTARSGGGGDSGISRSAINHKESLKQISAVRNLEKA